MNLNLNIFEKRGGAQEALLSAKLGVVMDSNGVYFSRL